jgi:hypothetical protein
MLAVSEVTKYGVMSIGMLLAAVSPGPLALFCVTGLGMLLSAAALVWFWHPMSLSKAYKHLALTYTGQFGLLKHLRHAAAPLHERKLHLHASHTCRFCTCRFCISHM